MPRVRPFARHVSILRVSKRIVVPMKTGSRHNVPRFQRHCCAGEEKLSLSLSLLRSSEGMEIDNIPLFEPVSPRPYRVFFYDVNSWFHFFQTRLKVEQPFPILFRFFFRSLFQLIDQYTLFYTTYYVKLLFCIEVWTMLYDISKSRNSWTIIKRGDISFESFNR